MRNLIIGVCILGSFIWTQTVVAQVCTSIGQTPETAFPVCGTSVFVQNSVPICSTSSLFVPGCSGSGGANYENKNPYWYKFTCYQTGTLGFLVTPNNLGDDYDWQLYDVTGLPPSAVFTNRNIIVSGNWAGTYGPTGASASGVNFIQCASNPADNRNSFAQMPTIVQGREYILLISHFTDTQSGYSLSFGGGTAVITDPKEPKLGTATANCDGTLIRLSLNKKMRCNSLAANGSDFRTNLTGIQPIGAIATTCAAGFDMDSVLITLNNPLPPGTHTLYIKNGTDANTLKDNCGREIPVNDSVTFTVLPMFPTPMDSIKPIGCRPDKATLVFKKPMRCSSISNSDFVINGPAPVSFTASGVCNADGLTSVINLVFSTPIVTGGTYTITLQNGSDGNTIIDECGQPTLPTSISFTAADTVNANFNTSIQYACDANTITYTHPGGNNINSWQWNFGGGTISTQQNPVIRYADFTDKTTTLIVKNNLCSDTSVRTIKFANYLKAEFTYTPILCPTDAANFKDTSIGNIVQWRWIFDNGNIFTGKVPPPQYYVANPSTDKYVHPQLIVTNDYGCSDTVSHAIQVVFSCFTDVPTAFTPNGDGLNDYLYPLGAYHASNIRFMVYNRFGQRLFYSEDRNRKWDGRFKGAPQPPGTYVWMLEYMDQITGQKMFKKGTVILIR